MFLTVLPLRAIVFQVLFLLIAIAIEALVLHSRLEIARRKSVEYAAFMNLLSAILGWIVFFFMVSRLSGELKAQLLSYIFYDNFSALYRSSNPMPWLLLMSFATFLATFVIKNKTLEVFQLFLERHSPQDSAKPANLNEFSMEAILTIGNKIIFGSTPLTKSLTHKSPERITLFSRRQSLAILWGHLCSNSIILVILFLRTQLPQ
ncbi:filament integrity protein FraC [Microcoleus sp. FACHB-672]|uniref:filament integrity protein FraC n=1 Tax=Microcoleus sp. FACHB-672 TaxID=2692825 RepID=UPI001685AD8B|nr:filament integrity protein FraC [Microcoleus sp. FACHB-672]MBD2040092.1 hypothetical protein [Microcoleus sp. FACHB-672]